MFLCLMFVCVWTRSLKIGYDNLTYTKRSEPKSEEAEEANPTLEWKPCLAGFHHNLSI